MFLIAKRFYMKPKLYLLLLVPLVMFASCTKWTVDTPASGIVGSWRIAYVERQTSYGSQPENTGYENGTFYFSSGGNAEYSDHIGDMSGSWRIVQRSGGNSLELRLYDYYGDGAIEWEFYSVEISGNRMIGYMTRYGYDYRFEFRRY